MLLYQFPIQEPFLHLDFLYIWQLISVVRVNLRPDIVHSCLYRMNETIAIMKDVIKYFIFPIVFLNVFLLNVFGDDSFNMKNSIYPVNFILKFLIKFHINNSRDN